MKAVDLFCGAGGLTQGLVRAGWDVVAGFDIEEGLSETYERNNPGATFIRADVRDITVDWIEPLLQGGVSDELLLAGCAPCQPFSKQRQRRGLSERRDGALLGEFARLVRALRPRAVLMENVPGIAAVAGFSAFRRFVHTLRGCGYSCDYRVLNARDFGVPQHRRRLVLLAIRDGLARLPVANEEVGPDVTVREAIGHFPEILAGEADASIANHRAAGLSSLNTRRIKATPPDGGDRRDWPKGLGLPCHRHQGVGFSDVYGRMWWDRAAPTLTSRCNSLSNGRFGHPEQDRAISLREAAALQTFDDDYVFYGPNNHIARWIGNAVPVLFGEGIGRSALRGLADGPNGNH